MKLEKDNGAEVIDTVHNGLATSEGVGKNLKQFG